MSNMSYCRFRNTLSDLRDCHEWMNETGDLMEEEVQARLRMIKLCRQIDEEYGHEIDETPHEEEE